MQKKKNFNIRILKVKVERPLNNLEFLNCHLPPKDLVKQI
mgnify:CR=1 FL=1